MSKYSTKFVPKDTPIFIHRALGDKKAKWKIFTTTKEVSFGEAQIIKDFSEMSFLVEGYITFRFRNWLAAVKTELVQERVLWHD